MEVSDDVAVALRARYNKTYYSLDVDDGHTGTDTERESFQRLLRDVMSGKINCVVVKDYSCFARNYSDAGLTQL